MQSLKEALTKEYLKKLELLTLSVKNTLPSGSSGARKSRAKGMSLEFSEFRDYAPGDDLRRIDWNSYGRFDQLNIKVFAEEKQAAINIFIDSSLSMDFGDNNKGFYAKLFAASITYIALRNTDCVNVFTCNESINLSKTKISTKNLFLHVVEFLDRIEFSGGTTLSRSIMGFKNINLGVGISFVISDFFSQDGFEAGVKFLLSKKQEVSLLHILSEEEINPTVTDAVRLFDLETKKTVDLYVTQDVLKQYKKQFINYQNMITDYCRKNAVTYILADTSQGFGAVGPKILMSLGL